LTKIDANRGALLRADVHIYEKEYDQAEKSAEPRAGRCRHTTRRHPDAKLGNVGFSLINEKERPRRKNCSSAWWPPT